MAVRRSARRDSGDAGCVRRSLAQQKVSAKVRDASRSRPRRRHPEENWNGALAKIKRSAGGAAAHRVRRLQESTSCSGTYYLQQDANADGTAKLPVEQADRLRARCCREKLPRTKTSGPAASSVPASTASPSRPPFAY